MCNFGRGSATVRARSRFDGAAWSARHLLLVTLGVANNGISIKNTSTNMPSPNPDDILLLIRCPSCGQRFKVGEDLRGRTVECGGCEHRFRINDDVIVRGKKFYPGESKDRFLNRFHRVPLAMNPEMSALPIVKYAESPSPVSFEPVSPLRVIAGIAGVVGMVFIALLFMFGTNHGGMLDGMPTVNRLVMAGFAGAMGAVLLIYANPRARMKALGIGLAFAAGLVSLPFVFTAGSEPVKGKSVIAGLEPADTPPKESDDGADSKLRSQIGTRPLEDEIARLATEGGDRKAVGLWLRSLSEANRLLVRDYVLRVTGADPQSHFYPRGDGDFLMVVTGIKQSLEEVAESTKVLGTVRNSYPELSVIEILVNNEGFLSGPIDKLSDREHPSFYDLNKRELESIDLTKVSDAVKRLAEAEPKIYRSDITRKFIELLGSDWVDFKGDICHALAVWSEKPGPAGEAALKEVRKMLVAKQNVPPEMIALIVREKNPDVVPVIDELWSENPTRWETHYGNVGPAAEVVLLRRFPSAEGSLRYSVVRILGRVGGTKSLPMLEAAGEGADAELRILLKNSVASIRARAGL